jgi:hypothetical protein
MIDETSRNKEDLSPKAKALADQLGKDGNIAQALKRDPSLIEGLDEYQKWRDREHREDGRSIGRESNQRPIAHGAAKALRKLSPPKKRKK